MEKDNKKKAVPEINEEQMMNLMVDGVKKEGLRLPAETSEEEPRTKTAGNIKEKREPKGKSNLKRNSDSDYQEIFFKSVSTNARDGKTVYIRPDFHEKLCRIIQVVGDDKISIYAYLDNVLNYHFQEFGEQITKSFNDKYKPIL